MVAVTTILLSGVAALIIGSELLAAVSVVASWLSVALAVAIGIGLTYQMFTEGYLSDFFDTEEIELVSSVLVGVVAGFVGYRLIEALLATLGLSVAIIVGALVVLSIVFTPAYVVGGISTGIGILVDLLDALGGEN